MEGGAKEHRRSQFLDFVIVVFYTNLIVEASYGQTATPLHGGAFQPPLILIRLVTCKVIFMSIPTVVEQLDVHSIQIST